MSYSKSSQNRKDEMPLPQNAETHFAVLVQVRVESNTAATSWH